MIYDDNKNILILLLFFFFVSFSLLGTHYFKYVYCINIFSLFLCTKFQLLNPRIFILNFFIIFFLIIYSNDIDFSRFLIIILLFIFSFQFKISKKQNINIFIISLFFFFSISLFFLYPSSEKFYGMVDVSNTRLYYNLYENYAYDKFLLGELANIKSPPSKLLMLIDGSLYYDYCYNSFFKNPNTCKTLLWGYTRLSYNKLDPNLAALMLISVSNFLTFSLYLKNNYPKIIIFLIFFMVILYATQSRVLYIYLFSYFLSYYFLKFEKKIKIVNLFILFNLFVYIVSFVIEFNSKNIFSEYISVYRLVDIYDNSIKLRFGQLQDSILLQIFNFQNILMPDHHDLISKIHYDGREISNVSYSPHNSILALIKDVGLVITLVFFYNLHNLVNSSDNVFKFYLFPLLMSSTFLGYSIFLLIIFFIFVSLKIKNTADKYLISS
jgi:hypothetical protein